VSNNKEIVMLTHAEMIARYGNVSLRFKNYYKYTFYFDYDGYDAKIVGEIGGEPSEIYRLEISSTSSYLVSEYLDCFNSLKIYDKQGNILFEYESE